MCCAVELPTGTEQQFVNHTFPRCSIDMDDNLPYQANQSGRRRKMGGGPPQLITPPQGNSRDSQDPNIRLNSEMLASSPSRGPTSSSHNADTVRSNRLQRPSSDVCTSCLCDVVRCRCRRPTVAYDLCFGPRLG